MTYFKENILTHIWQTQYFNSGFCVILCGETQINRSINSISLLFNPQNCVGLRMSLVKESSAYNTCTKGNVKERVVASCGMRSPQRAGTPVFNQPTASQPPAHATWEIWHCSRGVADVAVLYCKVLSNINKLYTLDLICYIDIENNWETHSEATLTPLAAERCLLTEFVL